MLSTDHKLPLLNVLIISGTPGKGKVKMQLKCLTTSLSAPTLLFPHAALVSRDHTYNSFNFNTTYAKEMCELMLISVNICSSL